MKPVNLMRKAECSECRGLRNCDIRGRYDVKYDDAGGHVWGNTAWYILECRGCEHVFIQTASTSSEDVDQWYEEDGSSGSLYNETLKYWPALSKRSYPDWMTEHGIEAGDADALDSALLELYIALNNDLSIFSAIGIRTCFDIASELLKVDPGFTFAEKLDALVDGKHIREADRPRLDTAIEAGNATAHRGWKPQAADLETMMKVLEDFIFDAFVQPHRRKKLDDNAAKVRVTVPPRPPRRTKTVKSMSATPKQVT